MRLDELGQHLRITALILCGTILFILLSANAQAGAGFGNEVSMQLHYSQVKNSMVDVYNRQIERKIKQLRKKLEKEKGEQGQACLKDIQTQLQRLVNAQTDLIELNRANEKILTDQLIETNKRISTLTFGEKGLGKASWLARLYGAENRGGTIYQEAVVSAQAAARAVSSAFNLDLAGVLKQGGLLSSGYVGNAESIASKALKGFTKAYAKEKAGERINPRAVIGKLLRKSITGGITKAINKKLYKGLTPSGSRTTTSDALQKASSRASSMITNAVVENTLKETEKILAQSRKTLSSASPRQIKDALSSGFKSGFKLKPEQITNIVGQVILAVGNSYAEASQKAELKRLDGLKNSVNEAQAEAWRLEHLWHQTTRLMGSMKAARKVSLRLSKLARRSAIIPKRTVDHGGFDLGTAYSSVFKIQRRLLNLLDQCLGPQSGKKPVTKKPRKKNSPRASRPGKKNLTGDAYWLSKGHGGDVFQGEKICKACLHLLAELRHRKYDYKSTQRFEKDAGQTLSELKKEKTKGYTLQHKKRLREEIKDAERALRKYEKNTRKSGRAVQQARIKLVNCYRKHCEKKGKAKKKVSSIGGGTKGNGIRISTGYEENEFDQSRGKTTLPDNRRKVGGGARITPGGFRDRGDIGVIDDDAFKIDSGSCNSAANDITNPFIRALLASGSPVNKAGSALGQFALGALGIGGGIPFGGGGQDGARKVNKPKVPWYGLSNGDTTVEIGGWVYKPRSKKKKPEIRIAQRIKDSPDKGAPHMMILQNRDGQILRPTGYMIFEVWQHWKLTITITRDTWVNGAHTSHSVSRESTQWSELAERYRKIMEAPGIWEQFGVAPFGKIRGVIAQFPLPEHFNPADWTLVKHDTSKAMVNGKKVIKTVPFIVSIGQGEKNRLTFKAAPGGKTVYQTSHGCRTTEEVMNVALGMLVPDYLKGKAQKAPSQFKQKKTRWDAAHWARIFILQPPPTDKWLKAYHKLSQKMKVDSAVAIAGIIFRAATGLESWDSKRWQKEFSQLSSPLRNMAIMAANRWKHGMNEKQREEIYRSYSKLPPNLQHVFKREFIKTLAFNLFFDLRQPTPVAY